MITRRKTKESLKYFFIAIVLIVWAFPIIWLIMGSFKPQQSIIEGDLFGIFVPTLENYISVFKTQNYARYLLNSLIVSILTTAISLIVGILAAYSVSRFKTGGKVYSSWVVFMRMTPPAILIIPFYLMFKSLGLINTVWALILANVTFNIPFVIWTMKGFFEALPSEMEEAAIIDGCSRIQTIFLISIPVVRSGILTTGIFCYLFIWNEYLFGLTLGLSEQSKTLPVAIGNFITGYAINWGPLFAAGTLIMFPALLVVMFLQNYIVDGLMVGSIK
jgi:multiple sugar transport system permease protein